MDDVREDINICDETTNLKVFGHRVTHKIFLNHNSVMRSISMDCETDDPTSESNRTLNIMSKLLALANERPSAIDSLEDRASFIFNKHKSCMSEKQQERGMMLLHGFQAIRHT
jgi:hypothetical protein